MMNDDDDDYDDDRRELLGARARPLSLSGSSAPRPSQLMAINRYPKLQSKLASRLQGGRTHAGKRARATSCGAHRMQMHKSREAR